MELSEWRAQRAQGEPADLPSGLRVYLRRIGVLDLAAQGAIPATLAPQMNQLITNGQVRNVTVDDFKLYADMIALVCRACLVGPEGLDADELPFDDKVAVFTWANQAGGKLQLFREQAPQPVELAHHGNHVPPATILIPGA